jgi:2-O-(6-phospho-alpha-D-mannosyl)-D-glycerate hydrolase
MARTVSVVPHTHWDREWYAPFQRFRLRLVDLLDDLLPRLEADPSFRHFLLDGQMAVVDDYLEVRPQAEPVLRRLAASGRLAMGPWYALPDEFLVSGETLVRNLQTGLRRAAAFAGAMEVGYLPDMFGHVAQMPQLLAQFGFEHAVVWRGVPSAVDRSGFWWEAPDRTTVRAEYLPEGYGNGARVPDDAKALIHLVDGFVTSHDDLLAGPVLWMVGTDHQTPRPWLGRVVTEANEAQDEFRLVIRSLAEHLADAPTEGLPRWSGELRSGARANLLMGVASNRVDVKVAAAVAERSLERVAEPLAALLQPADQWPGRLLELAWLEVIRNSAHDSVCACSHDDVVAAVLHRYAEARHIADGLTTRALRTLGRSLQATGAVIVNPSARDRGGVVELDLPGPVSAAGLQLLDEVPAEALLHDIVAADAVLVVEREIFLHPHLTDLELELDGDRARVLLRTGDRLLDAPPANTTEVLAALGRHAAEHPDGRVQIERHSLPRRTMLARVDAVPGFGWAPWDPSAAEAAPDVSGDGLTLANGLIAVAVDPSDGTFSIDGHAGLGRLVDDGDEGDTYNWSPPDADRVVDRPAAVTVAAEETGPVRARLVVDAIYELPRGIEDHGRAGEVEVPVRTVIELRSGEDFVRVTTTVDNQARDHRLRAWFPLPERADHSEAECAFTVVRRGLEAEGGPTERPMTTFPSRRFVRAGGLTVAHEGLLEYQLVDVARGTAGALALTLLRCTGMLSRGPMTMRPLPAGPEHPLEGPQLQGRQTLRYAVRVGAGDPYTLVDDAFVPLLVATGEGRGSVPDRGQALAVSGAEVSAVVRDGAALQVRVFNPTDAPTTVHLDGRRGWLVDLRGRPQQPFEDQFDLAPHRIATAVLSP